MPSGTSPLHGRSGGMTETLAIDSEQAVAPEDVTAEARVLTPHLTLETVIMLVNPQAGGVGPRAVEEAEAILAEYPCRSTVVTLESDHFDAQIQAALEACPDVLFVLAGDGTAGTVASRAGSDGPLVSPLPGGTMNMLPKALYGTGDWKAALRLALEEGASQVVAGGEISDSQTRRTFYCAAILGSPALWAPAREAVRDGRFSLALSYARRALKRSFSGRLRYTLDDRADGRAEALVLISPMISRAMDEHTGLEAAVMNPADAAEVLRLAANAVMKDWRDDPSVTTRSIRRATIRARSRIPAVIDGEPILLRHEARVRFVKTAFRALAPIPAVAEDSV